MLSRIRFSMSLPGGDRVHHVNQADVRVILSRLPIDLWSRLRAVHFNDRGQARRQFEGGIVAVEGAARGPVAKREVAERVVVERQKENWRRAVSTWRTGFTGRGRAVLAEPLSGPGYYSHGAAGVFEKAARELYGQEAVRSGARAVRNDRAAFADRDSDRTAEARLGRGAVT